MKDTIWLDKDGHDERDDLRSARGIGHAFVVGLLAWLVIYLIASLLH